MARLVGLAMMALLVAAPARAQIDPRGALLERTGWDAITAGQGAAAAKAFREAFAADPKNARLHLGAGLAATLERRDEDAKDEFERALVLDPKLTRARALLGEVLYRLGDLSEAIRTYETLTADSPEDRDAQATLERWRREADLHDRMQRAIGSHFTVSFEGPAEAELAAQALESLDRAYWRIGPLLGVYPSDPIPVVLYTSEQFRDITRSPSWAAGAYDGTIRVPMRGALDKSTELDRVLAHEFTHALIRTLASRNVPMWLNEGLRYESAAGSAARMRCRYTESVTDGLAQLIARIDDAVQLRDPDAITHRIKRELEDAIHTRRVTLPGRFHRVRPEGYARRLLH